MCSVRTKGPFPVCVVPAFGQGHQSQTRTLKRAGMRRLLGSDDDIFVRKTEVIDA